MCDVSYGCAKCLVRKSYKLEHRVLQCQESIKEQQNQREIQTKISVTAVPVLSKNRAQNRTDRIKI
jgi:hypothetical protein